MAHFTGLQVAKQPGQHGIWAGCLLMVAGLTVSFYISHQRIWGVIRVTEKGKAVVLLGGSSNKNKLSFESQFLRLETSLRGSTSVEVSSPHAQELGHA